MTHEIRPVQETDLRPLTDLWHDGWREAHAAHVPPELLRLRRHASFAKRLVAFGDAARTAGPVGAPLGFAAVKEAELDQLYVSPAGRGTGLAEALVDDALGRIRATGHTRALLFCAPENARAARFYERIGWRNTGLKVVALDTEEGPFDLPVFIFEKAL